MCIFGTIFLFFFLFICMFSHVHVYMGTCIQVPTKMKVDLLDPGTAVRGGCEPPDVGCLEWTMVFCKSSEPSLWWSRNNFHSGHDDWASPHILKPNVFKCMLLYMHDFLPILLSTTISLFNVFSVWVTDYIEHRLLPKATYSGYSN